MIFFAPPIHSNPTPVYNYGPSKRDLCEIDKIVENIDGTKTITKCRIEFPMMKHFPTGSFATSDSVCTCRTRQEKK